MSFLLLCRPIPVCFDLKLNFSSLALIHALLRNKTVVCNVLVYFFLQDLSADFLAVCLKASGTISNKGYMLTMVYWLS